MKKFISIIFICLLAFIFVACGETPKTYSLTINDADKVISLVEGEEKTVVPTVTEGATLVWETSAAGVATVDGGKITAVAEGSATITVSVKEQADLKVTISVTVEAKKVEVKYELKVTEKSVTMVVDDVKTITPTYTQGATLVWASSDATVVSVVNGKLTALKAGTATITVAYGDVKAEFAVEVTDDAFFKVELNGKMDDALWSDSVKAHKKSIKAGEQYVDIYAARNSKGIYVYGDYVTDAVRNNGPEWWQQDNVEWRFVTKADPSTKDTDQIWISSMGGGSHNAKDGHVTPLTLNEETQ